MFRTLKTIGTTVLFLIAAPALAYTVGWTYNSTYNSVTQYPGAATAVGIGTSTAPNLFSIQGTTATNGAALGSELINSGSWVLTAGWSTADNITFAHAGSGGTGTLSQTVPIQAGHYYKLVYTQSGRTVSSVTVSMGGVTQTTDSTNTTKTNYFYTTTSAALTFTPLLTTWNGSVSNISLKEVVNTPQIRLFDSTGAPTLDIAGQISFGSSTFIGFQAGFNNNLSGGATTNTGFGYQALFRNDTGTDNTAIGYQAMGVPSNSLNTGTQNTAIGSGVLTGITTGANNTAVGYFAGNALTTGSNNTLIGEFSARLASTISQNSSVGVLTFERLTTGARNSALGYASCRLNGTGADNVCVGYEAGQGVTSNNFSQNTLLGSLAGFAISTGSSNIIIGYNTATTTATGANNILIGTNTELPVVNGSNQLNIGNIIFGTGLTGLADGTTYSIAGNIGIGTTTPFANLSIATPPGASGSQSTLFAIASSTPTATTTLFSMNNAGNMTATGALTIGGNFVANNVTVGPGARYLFSGASQIFGAVDGVIRFTNSTNNDFTRFQFGGVTSSFPAFTVVTGTQTVALNRADGSLGGIFGVGTTTPFAKFAIHADNGETNTTLFAIGSSTATATTTLFSVKNDGTMFAPSTASSGANQTGYWCYDANGQFIRDTTTCLVSAAKFKKDIRPLDIGLTELMKVQPVTYYNKDPQFGTGQQIGVIADQVATIDQRLIVRDSNGDIHGFNYEQYTVWITKAVQELNDKVDGKAIYVNAKRSVEEDWQDIFIGLLFIWCLYLTFRRK